MRRPQPVGIELLFTRQEENGLNGAAAFDASALRSDFGFVYDHATPIGEIVMAAPSFYRLTARFHGRAAPLVESSPLLGSQAMFHRLSRCRTRRWRSLSRLAGGGLSLVSALAEGDQAIGPGGCEVGVGGIAGVGEHRLDQVVLAAGQPV